MAYNIADLFEHAVDAVPRRVALVIGREHLSYADLEDGANRVAHHFRDHDFGRGDHIGILGVNSRAWVETMLACFKLRAVPINVNFRYVEDELRYIVNNADLGALVVDRSLAPRVAAIRPDVPALRHLVHIDDGSDVDLGALDSVSFEQARAAGGPERDFGPRSGDDLYVLYTGGTTGVPKGVVWRQEDVFYALGGGIDAYSNEPVASEMQLADKARATESPLRSLCLPPLMHGAAQWGVLRFLFDGSTTVLLPRFDPHEAWRTVAREQVHNVSITGDAMARPLIEALVEMEAEQLDLSSLVVLVSTAALFSPSVKDRFLDRFPDLIVVDAIGSSETGGNGMAMIKPGATEMRGGPTVQPSRDAVVLDEDLNELAPGSPTIGRLARRGNIPLGYHKDEAKTRATFVTAANGTRYALSGDMAVHEADGTITLLGRGSQCINTGGEKVYPEEVETVLKAHPDVFDALVVGVSDERWGERVTAVVQPRGNARPTVDELSVHCRVRLAGYKTPRQLVLVDVVRRSPSGKPDYPWAQKVAIDAR